MKPIKETIICHTELIKETIVYQNLDDLKKAFASNNSRRIKYGYPMLRGSLNRERVLKRRKYKVNQKKKKKRNNRQGEILFILDEFANV